MRLLILALLVSFTAHADSGNSSYPGYGDKHWKAPVASVAALPTGSSNAMGDTRTTLDTFLVYTWTGSAWVSSAGTVSSVAMTVPSFLSVSGSPVTTTGTLALSLSGTALPVTSGGTGSTSYTSGSIPYSNGTILTQDNTNLTFDTSDSSLHVKAGIELGTVDQFSRTQIWNRLTGATLKLGASTYDSPYSAVESQGILVYGKNSNGDPMDGTNLGYARIKADRFALFNDIAGVNGDIFHVDPTSMYLATNALVKTFEVTRATGAIDTSLGAGAVSSDASGILSAGVLTIANGGTGVSLSATGGTSQVLKQASVGANVTVGQLACSDLSNAAASCSTDATNMSNAASGTLAVARGGTNLASGTSGGVLAYTASGVLASSGALTASQLVIGGGAGATPSSLAAGSQYVPLTMGASNPGYTALALNQSVATSGQLLNSRGGTGLDTSASTGIPHVSSGTWSVSALADADMTAITSFSYTSGVSIKGTTTNNSASAGYVGEVARAVQATAASFPTSGQWGDCTSVSLTAGDWDVSANFYFSANGATVTQVLSGISSTTGNSSTGLVEGDNLAATIGPNSTSGTASAISNFRVSLSGTTTYYAKIFAQYTVATPQYYCRISARRAR